MIAATAASASFLFLGIWRACPHRACNLGKIPSSVNLLLWLGASASLSVLGYQLGLPLIAPIALAVVFPLLVVNAFSRVL